MPANARPMHPARANALAARNRTYEGAPCEAGHVVRYTGSRSCVACQGIAQSKRRTDARRIAAQMKDVQS